MSTYRYAAKIGHDRLRVYPWTFRCEGCNTGSLFIRTLPEVHALAARHAAECEVLHRANLAAACACTSDGQPNPACLVCLGYGFEREREGLS